MNALLPFLQEINNFYLFESHGVHVSPVNFYQPVPHVTEVPKALWPAPFDMPGVDWSPERFLSILVWFCLWHEVVMQSSCLFHLGGSMQASGQ